MRKAGAVIASCLFCAGDYALWRIQLSFVMLPAHPSEICFAFHRAGSAGHPGSKQPHVKRVALFNYHGQLNKGSTKVLMFPFATPCKARGFQSKQLNFIISTLC
jgi:hypothetical protein